ncbi:MAG: TIGR04283 family arsenosugar biosynthesis glycosyltransferase [Magnetococcales bacterium]|nr:TIGR04283 family arsenosugar biosynthesis glycosyltransferase [Magnetococcales bacterium]
MTTPLLIVIIPTWNEQETLPRILQQLHQQVGVTLEILIADGGSGDDTQKIAQNAGVRFITAPRGRGAQMNAAANLTTGENLLFLHADSDFGNDPHLLSRAFSFYRATAEKSCAGHFPLNFVDQPTGYQWLFRFLEKKSTTNRPECIHGDQGLLISRAFFQQLGGFSEDLPFMEDQHLAIRIAQQGRWITLPGKLATSARRFRREGVTQRMLLNALIMTSFHSDFAEFLHQTPTLYRSQDITRPLQLTTFFQLFCKLDQKANLKTRWNRWLKIGRLARQSLWQIFLLLGLPVCQSSKPQLTFEKFVWYDLLFMGFAWSGFMLIRLWYALWEKILVNACIKSYNQFLASFFI